VKTEQSSEMSAHKSPKKERIQVTRPRKFEINMDQINNLQLYFRLYGSASAKLKFINQNIHLIFEEGLYFFF